MTALTVPSGNYVVPDGATLSGFAIHLQDPLGSVLLGVGSTLRDSQVLCGSAHAAHGVIMSPGSTVLACRVDQAGLDGIVLPGADGARVIFSKITRSGRAGLRAVNARDVEVSVCWLVDNPEGIRGEGVLDSAIIATLTHGAGGIALDAASLGNQIVRSRARQGGGLILAPDGNLILACVDEAHEFFTVGDPAAFAPRWHTAGTLESAQGGTQEFLSPQAALAAMAPGDCVCVDTNKTPGWGALVVDVPGVTIIGQGGRANGWSGAMKGTYSYINFLESLTVTAPGVRVVNFVIRGSIAVQPDTMLEAVDVP